MRRLTLPMVGALLVVAIVWPNVQTASARPESDELLRIEGQLTYVIRPDAGPVHVEWQVQLSNNDPQTTFREVGTVYFYENVSLPVLRGASGIRATGPGGAGLNVALDESTDAPLIAATITFDRLLYYGQQYAFTLSYDLVDTRNDVMLITPAYVYLPAIVAGDSTSVRIITPSAADWEVTLEPIDCTQSAADEYRCGASEQVQVAALVEVSRPDALQSIDTTVSLAEGDVSLTISYFPGEKRWASHIRELAAAALPVLETLFGFPYDGPRNITIAERGRQDIAGYEGTFGCLAGSCGVGLSPVADDSIAVHEFAHLWTEMFEKRWLAEGLAEFMSLRAADELGPLLSGRSDGPSPRFVDLQLDDWRRVGYLIGADEDELALEATGYLESRRFFETLVEAIGLEALQIANAAAAEHARGVDSQTYMDLLEEASGLRLDGLFLELVFPPSFAPVLEQRLLVRERLTRLEEAVEAVDFSLPERASILIESWRFDDAEDLLDDAQAALDAYMVGRDSVEQDRSLWVSIGLLGKNPEGKLGAAAGAFAAGEFADAAERAEAAHAMIEDAGRAALIRVLAAAGVLTVVLLVAGGAVWFVRRGHALHSV